MTNVIAIIPARGGSKGLPRKNIRMMCGKPLIAHTLEQALDVELIDRVIVTTDDEEIAQVAKLYGAEVPFIRPAALADDLATTEETLKHAVEWIEENEDYQIDIVVFLTCTTVFRRREWIYEVTRRLLENPELETVFMAYMTHKNFWRKVQGKYVKLAADIKYASRQVREPLYREDTGIACATRSSLIKAGKRVGEKVDILATEDERTSIDIHTEYDFWLAEQVMTRWPMEEIQDGEDD